MFKEIYNGLNSEESNNIINILNNDSSDFNSFLKYHLEAINVSIESLNKTDFLVNTNSIKIMFKTYLLARDVIKVIENENTSIKTNVESIKLNCKSIINGVEKVAELNKKNMMALDSQDIFFYIGML